jgi:hypothetical protein
VVAAYTSDDLLSKIKARCQIPASEGRLSDTEIYSIADDVMLSSVGRDIYDADDGRWLASVYDISIVAGTAQYRLPDRAFGSDVDTIHIVDASGDEAPSSYVDRTEIALWMGSNAFSTGVYRHTIEGDQIRILPTPTQSTGTIRVRYLRDPSRLVPVASAGLVSSTTSTTIVIASAPSAFGTTPAYRIDVVEGTPSGDLLMQDASATRSTTTMTILAGVSTSVAAGDYVCLAGETCVPPLPRAAFPWLVAKASHEVLVALGDRNGADLLAPTVVARRQEVRDILAERSRQRPKVINRYSPLRGAGNIGPRRRWG